MCPVFNLTSCYVCARVAAGAVIAGVKAKFPEHDLDSKKQTMKDIIGSEVAKRS